MVVPTPGLEPGSSPYKGPVLTFELRWRRNEFAAKYSMTWPHGREVIHDFIALASNRTTMLLDLDVKHLMPIKTIEIFPRIALLMTDQPNAVVHEIVIVVCMTGDPNLDG